MLTEDSPGDYDLALIRLKKPVNITAHVRTICLPNVTDDDENDVVNRSHFVVGWGNVKDTPRYTRSTILKVCKLYVHLTDSFNLYVNFTFEQFCQYGHV